MNVNLDVVLAVMGSVMSMPEVSRPRSTIASMMLASRELYHEGAKELLSGNITLDNSRCVRSFVRCCLAEKGIRTAYVRGLSLCRILVDLPPSLPKLLPKLSNLTSLSLDPAELTFRDDKDRALLPAIASLTSLSRLELIKAGWLGCNLLHTLRAPLRELVYDRAELYESPQQLWLSDLSHSALSLEMLRLAGVSFRFVDKLEPRFPNMSHLVLDMTELDTPLFLVSDCILAFPNLKRLTATSPDSFIMDKMRDGVFWEARQRNKRDAARPGRSDPCTSLTELRTALPIAWAFGLSCKVEHLRLEVNTEWDIERMLPQVLADLRPTHLYLELQFFRNGLLAGYRGSLESPELTEFLANAVKDHHPELETVDVGLYLHFLRATSQLEHVLQGFVDLKAKSFRIIILGRTGDRCKDLEVADEQAMMLGLDPKTIVQRMVDVIPAVRRAAFEVRGFPERSSCMDSGSDS